MVLTIALLLFFQLAGTAIVTVTGLPIPGPVMGMLLFLFALMVKDNLLQQTLPVVNVLLAHFSLLFVPAGVGIMQHGARLAAEWRLHRHLNASGDGRNGDHGPHCDESDENSGVTHHVGLTSYLFTGNPPGSLEARAG